MTSFTEDEAYAQLANAIGAAWAAARPQALGSLREKRDGHGPLPETQPAMDTKVHPIKAAPKSLRDRGGNPKAGPHADDHAA